MEKREDQSHDPDFIKFKKAQIQAREDLLVECANAGEWDEMRTDLALAVNIGIDSNSIRDLKGNNLLIIAASNLHKESFSNNDRSYIFTKCSKNKSYYRTIMELLCFTGIDVNKQGEGQETALHHVVRNYGFWLKAADTENHDQAIFAKHCMRLQLINTMLLFKGRVDMPNAKGKTALHEAEGLLKELSDEEAKITSKPKMKGISSTDVCQEENSTSVSWKIKDVQTLVANMRAANNEHLRKPLSEKEKSIRQIKAWRKELNGLKFGTNAKTTEDVEWGEFQSASTGQK